MPAIHPHRTTVKLIVFKVLFSLFGLFGLRNQSHAAQISELENSVFWTVIMFTTRLITNVPLDLCRGFFTMIIMLLLQFSNVVEGAVSMGYNTTNEISIVAYTHHSLCPSKMISEWYKML